jgi:hypothetical protein
MTYQIQKVGEIALVFCTGYENPISKLQKIERDLSNFTGKVIFDLLLCNGNSSNRFAEAQISQGKVNRGSMKIVGRLDLDQSTVERIEKFYQGNGKLIEESLILDDQEKELMNCVVS